MKTSKDDHGVVYIPIIKTVQDLERFYQWRASEQAKDITPNVGRNA